jgi:hypothetical protein
MVPKCGIGCMVNICRDFTSNIISPTAGLLIMVLIVFIEVIGQNVLDT